MGRMVNIEAHKLRIIERINREDEISFFDLVWIANTFFDEVACANPAELIIKKVSAMSDKQFESFCAVLMYLREAKERGPMIKNKYEN